MVWQPRFGTLKYGPNFHFLLCIASWHTYLKLAKLNIANIENLKREQTPPQIPNPSAIAQISKTKYSWSYIFVQEGITPAINKQNDGVRRAVGHWRDAHVQLLFSIVIPSLALRWRGRCRHNPEAAGRRRESPVFLDLGGKWWSFYWRWWKAENLGTYQN